MNSRLPVSYASWAPQRPNINDGNLHDCSLLDCTNNVDCNWKDTTCGEDINDEHPVSFICQMASDDEKTTTEEAVTTPSVETSPGPITTTVTSPPITTTVTSPPITTTVQPGKKVNASEYLNVWEFIETFLRPKDLIIYN